MHFYLEYLPSASEFSGKEETRFRPDLGTEKTVNPTRADKEAGRSARIPKPFLIALQDEA